MLLSYETSSITYDEIELIHGKFIPAKPVNFSMCKNVDCEVYRPAEPKVRFFINIYGVFANLIGRFAQKYDGLQIPNRVDCVVDPDFIRNSIPKVGVEAILEEEGFWKGVEAYPWYMLMVQEFYNISGGEYYLMLPLYNSLQLEDRLVWVWRHFGNQAHARTVLLTCDMAKLLIRGREDIFIGSDLMNCEGWALSGGSSFWWPEIDGKCAEPSKLLTKRIKLLGQVVADLKAIHPGSRESIYNAGVLRDKFLENEEKRKKYEEGLARSNQMAEEAKKKV